VGYERADGHLVQKVVGDVLGSQTTSRMGGEMTYLHMFTKQLSMDDMVLRYRKSRCRSKGHCDIVAVVKITRDPRSKKKSNLKRLAPRIKVRESSRYSLR